MTDADSSLPESKFRLTSLGSASLTRGGAASPLVVLRPGKPLALLTYLASLPGRTASREHLLNLLWADVEPERGLKTLRQTVFQLRQLIGDDSIVASGRELCLELQLDYDRDEFLAAVAGGDSEKAATLYKGPFLVDFGIPGGAEFEQWADRERDRLQSAYVRAAESVVRSRLDRAQYDAAIAEARRLRNFDPSLESSWRLLLEALASSGDRTAAITEAEDLERYLESENREPESLTRSAISRTKRIPAPEAETSSPRLEAELTGRDREFSRLTSAWAIVKSGHFRHIHVSAPPGFGKTRLLHDVFTRLRASGARALWMDAIAADRKLAYALASDIAGKVGLLSGASGISTAAASSLIALNPKLSSSFAATPDRSEGEEALRRRVHAVTELFEAVADEAPIAVFIDDLHWSDPVSRQLLKSAFSRIGDCRILLVTSARAVADGSLNLVNTELLSLAPLDRDQVKQLLSSFAYLGNDELSEKVVDTLHDHAGGSPLLVLENVHLAMDRELLGIQDGAWQIHDPATLLETMSRGDVLEERIRKLDARLFQLLLVLSVAEDVVPPEVLASALGTERSAVESDLATLEQNALAASAGHGWRCSHDAIAETAVRIVSPSDRMGAHRALGLARLQSSNLDYLRLAIRHLSIAGESAKVKEAFARAIAVLRAAGDPRTNLQLAAAMLGENLPSEAASRLAASLPIGERFSFAAVSRMVVAMSVVAAIIAMILWSHPAKPSQLTITTQPLSANRLVVPPPVIEIEDRNGQRVRGASDTVVVETVEKTPGISGTLAVAAVDGRAEFKDISVNGEGPFQLRFKSKGLKPVVSHKLNVTGTMPTLKLVSGVVNGQRVSPSHRAIIVKPGETISGNLVLEYSSYWGSASVILGATATWGDRRKNYLDLAPLFTPAENQPRRVSIRFVAPQTYGIYHIVFAFDAEGNVEDFMSGTNWRVAEPIWNDGNDIADWSPAQLAQANARGWAQSTFVQIDNVTGKPRTDPHAVAATVIDVIVK